MIVQQRTYVGGLGWSQPLPAELDSAQTLVLIFASSALLNPPHTMLTDLQQTFPQAILFGASTQAAISGGEMMTERGVVAVCRFEKTKLATTLQSITTSAESYVTGMTLAKKLWRPDLTLLMVLADDTVIDVNELMRGLNSVLPPSVRVTGGLAGHLDHATGRRVVVAKEGAGPHIAAAVGLYGDALRVSQVYSGGWQDRSGVYEVTRAEGRVLYELNHRPAAEVYRQFLGSLASYLTEALQHIFPVGFYDHPDQKVRVVRSVLGVDEATGGLLFPAEVPSSRYLRFMLGLPSQFIDSAAASAENAVQQFGFAGTTLAVMVSCIGRYIAMQDDAAKEAQKAFTKLGPHTIQIGFYGHGEIAPSAAGGSELHNHTVNITLLGEL